MFHEQLGEGDPTRLFISGLHGREHNTTDPVLEEFASKISNKEIQGEIILHSLGKENRDYVSTLDKDYWDTRTGKELLSIIENHQPSVYLELHSFTNSSRLTDPKRIERKGVPPLVELDSGILAGSVAPYLRTNYFEKEDFCFLLEIPREGEFSNGLYDILEIIGFGKDRDEIIKNMESKYPKQMKKMKKYYELFYSGELSELLIDE